jgi:hypothetical protein
VRAEGFAQVVWAVAGDRRVGAAAGENKTSSLCGQVQIAPYRHLTPVSTPGVSRGWRKQTGHRDRG